jgi:hypothetical protein
MFFTLYLYLRQIGVIKKDIKVIEIANLTQQNEYRGGELRPFQDLSQYHKTQEK